MVWLVTDNCLNRIPASSEYTAEEFFSTNHSIKFKYKQDFITKCRQKGDCGFILQVTASTGKQDDSFNIQLVIDPSLYPADIHFHQESLKLVDNLHFALDLVAHNDQVFRDRSVTWYGKPCRDGTGRYWCWGAHYFYRSGKGTAPPGEVLRRVTASGASTRIRPAVYLLGWLLTLVSGFKDASVLLVTRHLSDSSNFVVGQMLVSDKCRCRTNVAQSGLLDAHYRSPADWR